MDLVHAVGREGAAHCARGGRLPKSEIEELIGRERRRRSEQILLRLAAVEARRKTLLTQYEGNHNGAFDPAEKAEAIDYPAFLELELKTIDADQNSRLEAGELNSFDGNNDGILDAKEQAGIAAFQSQLANKLVEKTQAVGKRRCREIARGGCGAASRAVTGSSTEPR